jgi:hypothetical protein
VGEAGRAVETGHHVLEPGAREDRHAVPGRLAVQRHLIAARGELVTEQVAQLLVLELGLLKAHHVRLALVQPRQQPRHALLDRVHVPGRDPHRIHRTGRLAVGTR